MLLGKSKEAGGLRIRSSLSPLTGSLIESDGPNNFLTYSLVFPPAIHSS